MKYKNKGDMYKMLIVKSESHSVTSDSLRPHGLYSPWNSSGHNTGVGDCSLLQGIFPAQELNPEKCRDYVKSGNLVVQRASIMIIL